MRISAISLPSISQRRGSLSQVSRAWEMQNPERNSSGVFTERCLYTVLHTSF